MRLHVPSPWSLTWPVLRALAVGAVAAGAGLALRGSPWVGVPVVVAAAIVLFLAHEIPRRGELSALREVQEHARQRREEYERRGRRRRRSGGTWVHRGQ